MNGTDENGKFGDGSTDLYPSDIAGPLNGPTTVHPPWPAVAAAPATPAAPAGARAHSAGQQLKQTGALAPAQKLKQAGACNELEADELVMCNTLSVRISHARTHEAPCGGQAACRLRD